MAFTRERTDIEAEAIPLGPLLARSDRFKALFADGMQLVEDAASYLDGPGRGDAQALSAGLAEAYSAESMRLTSRLMQMASWLLIRRAMIDGEMASEDTGDRVKVTISSQERVSPPGVFMRLPATLQRLTERSMDLQRRVVHLDQMVNEHAHRDVAPALSEVAQQFARLQSAYGSPA